MIMDHKLCSNQNTGNPALCRDPLKKERIVQQNKSNADIFLRLRESYASAPQSETNKRFYLQVLRGLVKQCVANGRKSANPARGKLSAHLSGLPCLCGKF
jgi:hypothetical protein